MKKRNEMASKNRSIINLKIRKFVKFDPSSFAPNKYKS